MYRELGRIYYFTGRPDALERVLDAGIRAAHARHDLEQELILRGNLGTSLMNREGDYVRAAELFEGAIEQARLLSLGRTEGINIYRLAYIRSQQDRYDQALALIDSADVRYRAFLPGRRTDLLALRGNTLASMLRYDEAAAALEEAAVEADAHEDVVGQIHALVYLGNLEFQIGRYAEARAASLQAHGLAEGFGVTEFTILSRMLMGDVERVNANYGEAEEHYSRARLLAQEVGATAHVQRADERLGLLALLVGDINAAKERFEAYLGVAREGDGSLEYARALQGLGRTYAQYGNHEEAVRRYNQALEHVPEGADGSFQALVLRDKALSVAELDGPAAALDLLAQVRERLYDDPGARYRGDLLIGRMLLEQGEYRQALRRFVETERVEDELQWSSLHWEVLYGKAVAYWKLGERKQAETAFRAAIALVETLRDNLREPEHRSFFVLDKVSVYDDYAAFLEEEGRSRDAFAIQERARSRTLVDLLFTTQHAGRGEGKSSADRLVELNRTLRQIEEEAQADAYDIAALDEGADPVRARRVAYLRRERRRADSLYTRLELDLYGRQQIYSFRPLDTQAVQGVLEPGEALVAYRLGTPRGATAYVVLPDTLIARPLDVDPLELVEMVRFFRDGLVAGDGGPGSGWETVSRRLYEVLMEPVAAAMPASVRHVHLVPEGILHYLPFAALQDGDGAFLVERFTLSVVPSASMLKLCRDQNPRRWSYMLLLADPDGRLPGAREEVRAIAAQAPGRRHVLVGEKVAQQALEDAAARYDILHFATHGRFVRRAPWQSHLELHQDVLSVEEIGRLRLEAYLVTLSACETALSAGLTADVPSGDEWVGLSQAFLAAGSPTVLASLWEIDDRASSAFMVGFYDELGERGKGHALATVQRRFLQDESMRHPYYWAAFSIVGDPL